MLDKRDDDEYPDRDAEPADPRIQGCASCGYDPDYCGCGRYKNRTDDLFWAREE